MNWNRHHLNTLVVSLAALAVAAPVHAQVCDTVSLWRLVVDRFKRPTQSGRRIRRWMKKNGIADERFIIAWLSAAEGKVFIALRDGSVQCWGK